MQLRPGIISDSGPSLGWALLGRRTTGSASAPPWTPLGDHTHPRPVPLIFLFPTYPQAKKDASRFRALVLISVAAVCCAAFTPHMTRPSVASKLAEIYHPDACPPQWVPVLLASSSSHVDNPVPRFDEEDLPFEALSIERRMDEGAETDPDCGSEEDLAAVWACHLKCMNSHFDATTNTYKQPGHANCKKEECPTLCSPPPSPPLGPTPPLTSSPLPPKSPSPSPPTPPSPSPPPHEIEPDCGGEEDLAAVWACHLKCTSDHFDATTNTYKQPGHANCKKEECPTLCSPPPSPPLGPTPPLTSSPLPPKSPSPSPPTPPSPSPPPHEIEPDCGSAENLAAVWVCHLKCTSDHFNTTTDMYKEPENANCKKECPTLCSPPPSPPLGPPPPLASPPSPSPLCADKMHQQCKIQRCEIYKTSKKQRCKKTCGLCKAAPSAPASASASDDR